MKPMKHLLIALLTCWVVSAAPAQANNELSEISTLVEQRQFDAALGRLEGFLAKDPKNAQARFIKGLVLTEQNRRTEAIGVFKQLTEDFPNLPEPYNNLAVLYADAEDYEEAKAALVKAIKTHPAYVTAYENLGDIYAKLASQAYDRALELNGNNTATKAKLALVKKLFFVRGAINGGTEGTDSTGTTTTKLPEEPTPAKVAPAAPPPPPVEAALPEPAPLPAVSAPTPEPVADAGADHREQIKRDLVRAVHGWANAWSGKDVRSYLGHYSKSFDPGRGQSWDDWAADRGARIKRPRFIKVTLQDMKVFVAQDGKHAQVDFLQLYRADHYRDKVHKTLKLVLEDGSWKISREDSNG
ncbi:MAG: tetratricopeptide repeat protein [Magnetococcus sp. WYHC-3]